MESLGPKPPHKKISTPHTQNSAELQLFSSAINHQVQVSLTPDDAIITEIHTTLDRISEAITWLPLLSKELLTNDKDNKKIAHIHHKLQTLEKMALAVEKMINSHSNPSQKSSISFRDIIRSQHWKNLTQLFNEVEAAIRNQDLQKLLIHPNTEISSTPKAPMPPAEFDPTHCKLQEIRLANQLVLADIHEEIAKWETDPTILKDLDIIMDFLLDEQALKYLVDRKGKSNLVVDLPPSLQWIKTKRPEVWESLARLTSHPAHGDRLLRIVTGLNQTHDNGFDPDQHYLQQEEICLKLPNNLAIAITLSRDRLSHPKDIVRTEEKENLEALYGNIDHQLKSSENDMIFEIMMEKVVKTLNGQRPKEIITQGTQLLKNPTRESTIFWEDWPMFFHYMKEIAESQKEENRIDGEQWNDLFARLQQLSEGARSLHAALTKESDKIAQENPKIQARLNGSPSLLSKIPLLKKFSPENKLSTNEERSQEIATKLTTLKQRIKEINHGILRLAASNSTFSIPEIIRYTNQELLSSPWSSQWVGRLIRGQQKIVPQCLYTLLNHTSGDNPDDTKFRDFSNLDFYRFVFVGVDLSGQDLRNCNFANSNLKDANFNQAQLEGSNFENAKYPGRELLPIMEEQYPTMKSVLEHYEMPMTGCPSWEQIKKGLTPEVLAKATKLKEPTLLLVPPNSRQDKFAAINTPLTGDTTIYDPENNYLWSNGVPETKDWEVLIVDGAQNIEQDPAIDVGKKKQCQILKEWAQKLRNEGLEPLTGANSYLTLQMAKLQTNEVVDDNSYSVLNVDALIENWLVACGNYHHHIRLWSYYGDFLLHYGDLARLRAAVRVKI
ncbi:hypothetical protein CVV38_03095 [Candidatus Peregrinibacteria bacterium HGW-Peregrinibacteria-1]|jgi:uncharacterized protein YjbI with pentapeptide repeats|nr:MAG: hypothetical protein CVV38_03095 [Candidatus Peregrinibacteria bacterium HGW-Peregrinibacteria-1]